MRKIKNLVVGSGPAGIAAVKGLLDIGQPVEVIDVAYDLESDIKRQVDDLSNLPVDEWSQADKDKLFPPPIASSSGVERRYHFGSDFPYRVPAQFRASSHQCKTEFSHGLGGLGNVWGAAVMPYSERQLRDWPIAYGELSNSYKNVLDYVPITGEKDGLEDCFPLFTDNFKTLKKNAPTDFLLTKLHGSERLLHKNGIQSGRARLAVESGQGDRGCKYCGHCLDGCAYQSIFNPKTLFEELEQGGLAIHRGLLVLELNEGEQGVEVIAVQVNSGEVQKFLADKVFLGAGQFATATILARSLNYLNKPIGIKDSQYFFFPFFSYKGHRSEIEFTLAEAFLELDNATISSEPVHLQLYGRNHIIEDQVKALLPSFFPNQVVLDRLYIVQGFLSSEDSGSLELTLTKKQADASEVSIKGLESDRASEVALKVQSLIRRSLLKFGLVPPLNMTVVPPGRSFHTGGSFPMDGTHEVLRSDLIGRPAHYQNIHIVDSANFPNIAGSTIAYTIMANADRIVRSVSYT